MTKQQEKDRIIFLGSYDEDKPRVRMMRKGAHEAGFEVLELNVNIWAGVKDKSDLKKISQLARYFFGWLVSRPRLLVKYWRSPSHSVVIFPYPGVADVILFRVLTRLRRAQTCLDVFISIYETIVEDRQLLKSTSIIASLLYRVEAHAAEIVDIVISDTPPNSSNFSRIFPRTKRPPYYVPVGVETDIFKRVTHGPWSGVRPLKVLFYGQFVPLQGTLVLLDAIKLWEDSQYCRVDWVIIGRGQESSEFDRRLKQHNVPAIKRIEWVEYEELPAYIAAADVCLGIFGASQKALSVIPNKVYQILAVGRPLLTARTPGIQSLLSPSSAIELVRPNSPAAIVKGLRELSHRLATRPEEIQKATNQMPIVDSQQVGQQLAHVLKAASRS